ncbi:hypothetical protein HHA01_08790 [Halomonas halmophila]|uniref:Uncharacterized protein n=2 Tax=Halomonas halmophila TaxID=252 RepID=A0A4Y4EVH8_9GAMM|nr:hypothetical protein [Halomonas halmophila]GED21902.1 hypothetical protein HHA01_08790 [Halomonas halmophila]
MAWLTNFGTHWPEIADRYNECTRHMFRYYLSVYAGAFRARDLPLRQVVYSRRLTGKSSRSCTELTRHLRHFANI